MKTINIATDYQMKITQERHADNIISRIESGGGLEENLEITLDICGCALDYPATSKLIDYIFEHLSTLNGEKEFHILIDGLGFKEVYALCYTVLGSHFFGIYDKLNNDDVTEWRNIIISKTSKKKILFDIKYTSGNNNDKLYCYYERL